MKLLWKIIIREHKIVLTDRRLYVVAILGPLLYTLLLGSTYLNKKVYDAPLMIVDQDNSQTSRSITQALDVSESFKVAGYLDSASKFTDAVQSDKAYACVCFPKDFEQDIKRGKQGRVAVLLDGSNMLIANGTYKAVASVIGTYSAGAQIIKLSMKGVPNVGLRAAILPIEAQYRVWFNPSWNYMNFLLLGLIGTILQQVTLLAVALGLAKEWENRTGSSLTDITRSPAMALTGKFLAYLTLMLPMCLISISMPFCVFGLVNIGSGWLIIGATALFTAVLCFAGIAVSGITRDSLYTTQLLMLVAVPSFILSGFTWPTFAMPKALQYLSFALPLSHYLIILRKVAVMGAGIEYIHKPILVLCVWLLIGITGAYVSVRKLLKQATV